MGRPEALRPAVQAAVQAAAPPQAAHLALRPVDPLWDRRVGHHPEDRPRDLQPGVRHLVGHLPAGRLRGLLPVDHPQALLPVGRSQLSAFSVIVSFGSTRINPQGIILRFAGSHRRPGLATSS